jgi:hypothetical protein
MRGRFFLSMVLVLVIIAGAIGLGTYAYNAGIAQGLAQSGKVVVPDGGAVPYPYYGPFAYHPFGFGFGGFLFSCFFLFLIVGLIRAIFFRRHWGWHGRRGMWNDDVPPMAAEWHRKMHETKSNDV